MPRPALAVQRMSCYTMCRQLRRGFSPTWSRPSFISDLNGKPSVSGLPDLGFFISREARLPEVQVWR